MVSEHGSPAVFPIPAAWWRTAALGLVIAAASLIAYLVFERYLRTAVTIVLLAGMLTYLLQPMVEWMVRLCKGKHIHTVRILSVLIIYLMLAAIVAGYGAALAHTIKAEKAALTATWMNAREHIPQQVSNMQSWYETTVPAAIRDQLNIDLQREASQFPTKYWPKLFTWLVGFTQMTGKFIALSIELILIPLLIAFYFLTDSAKVREQVSFFIPRRYRTVVKKYTGGMDHILRQYVKGQLLLCTIAWVVVTLALLIMGIPGALLLGLVAGLSRAIPMIGPAVGGIPVLAAVFWNPHWSGAFLFVLIGFVVLHLFESKYLMPRILGDSLGIHPVLIILSLLIGYEVLGLLGMFLAPPTIAVIRFIVTMKRAEQRDLVATELPTG